MITTPPKLKWGDTSIGEINHIKKYIKIEIHLHNCHDSNEEIVNKVEQQSGCALNYLIAEGFISDNEKDCSWHVHIEVTKF